MWHCGAAGLAVADTFWWLHAFVLLSFLLLLPCPSTMTSSRDPNCFLDRSRARTRSRARSRAGQELRRGACGRLHMEGHPLLLLLHGCGRCQEACPPTPRTVAETRARSCTPSRSTSLPTRPPSSRAGSGDAARRRRGAGTNTLETIWACTTCGACMEHVLPPSSNTAQIVKRRRNS